MRRDFLAVMVCLATTVAIAEQVATQKIFLVSNVKSEVKRTCLDSLAATLRAEIGKVPGAVLAKSRLEADIVVEVRQCATSSVADVGGTIGVSTSSGARRGSGVMLGLGGSRSQNTTAKITLEGQHAGERKEFTSGPDVQSLDDASRATLRALLTWTGLVVKQDD